MCVRKTAQAIAAEQRRITRREQKQGWRVKPETREFAAYVMVFTTLPESAMSAAEVLEHYRFRWQIELVFKRLKSILAVGHLPKSDEQSSRAWLYGKLLVALLTQKVARLGSTISPWGYDLGQPPRAAQWREFQFALHQLQQTIAPALGLGKSLPHWNEIAAALAERNRNAFRNWIVQSLS